MLLHNFWQAADTLQEGENVNFDDGRPKDIEEGETSIDKTDAAKSPISRVRYIATIIRFTKHC